MRHCGRWLPGMLVTLLAAAPLAVAVSQAPTPQPGSQATVYRPSYQNPEGTERIAVFFSASFCVANQQPGFYPAVRRMARLLAAQARMAGVPFSVTGVSIDWAPDSGLAYLRRVGPFDEVLVGRNWYGFGTRLFAGGGVAAPTVIPQVILYERTVTGSRRSDHREVARLVGGDTIIAWVQNGARWPTVDRVAAP